MPDIIECPQCERRLKVPDTLRGKAVKCPTCGVAFQAEPADTGAPSPPETSASREPEPAPPTDASAGEEAPVRRRRRRVPSSEEYDQELAEREEEERSGDFGGVSAWTRVRTGVTLVLIAVCLKIGFSVLGGCAGGIAGAMGAQRARQQMGGVAQQPNPFAPTPEAAMVQNVGQVLALGAALVDLIGLFFCRSVPRRSRARTLADWSFYIAAGTFVLSILSAIVGFVEGRMPGVQGNPFALRNAGFALVGLGVLAFVMGITQNYTWLFFLRRVALHLKARSIAQSTRTLIILYSVLLGLLVLMVIIAWFAAGSFFVQAMQGGQNAGVPPNENAVGGLLLVLALACPLGIVGLVYLVWYIVVLTQMRGFLTEYLAEA